MVFVFDRGGVICLDQFSTVAYDLWAVDSLLLLTDTMVEYRCNHEWLCCDDLRIALRDGRRRSCLRAQLRAQQQCANHDKNGLIGNSHASRHVISPYWM